VLAASNPDEEAPRNYTRGPGSVSTNFICDLERLTERVLHGEPDSQKVWFRLLEGAPVESSITKDVVRRCGKSYFEANLHKYFQPSLRRHSGERGELRAA
jgi:hypothetical protein